MSFSINTERLILRVEDSSIAEEVLHFYIKNKPLFEQFEPTRPQNFYTLAYQIASMNYEYDQIIKGKNLRYYIYLKEDPKILIGILNFSRMEHGPFSRCSIGYKFDADYHGNGFALEACRAAISVVFSNYKIHRIEARVAPDNIPSIKLLEKLAFRYEGIEYQGVEVNGVFKDHYRYGLISTIQ